jgi:GT2 family glycosyltransferase
MASSATVPELSLIVASYKHHETLRLCLNSLRASLASSPISYEILVTDSATEIPTKDMMAKDFPDVEFFPFEENVGFQRIVREGLEHARGQYILVLNYDIVAPGKSIETLLAYLKQHPEIGMIGPKLLNFNGSLQPSAFRFYRPWTILYRRTFLGQLPFAKKHLAWFLMEDYDHQTPKEVDWLMGSALLVRREAYENVGPMDSRFFMYMEDVDWCRRFWEAGYKVVYYPDTTLYHYHGKGSAKGGFIRSLLFNRLTWYHIASAWKYFRKYSGKSIPQHQ